MWSESIEKSDFEVQEKLKSTGKIPEHIAIIMDGNGRWAKQRLSPRLLGHREGIESVRDIVKASSQLGVKHLTLYAFSIENWKRPKQEVNGLMQLLENYLKKEIDELHLNKVKLNTIGKITSLPSNVQNILIKSIEKTSNNDGLNLTLALSYGARWDITRAVQLISIDVRRGKLSPEDINEETFSKYLNTNFLPDPDLVIRTSGEYRVSNFLLWEIAYSEFYVTETLWPKFRRDEYYKAITNFQKRERRFGKISEQVVNDKKFSLLEKASNVFKKN